LGDPSVPTATIHTIADLEELYGPANPNSLLKETQYLTPAYRTWLAAAPFFALATSGPAGLDCSPRGDQTGALLILDDKTLAIPDRRGNNRLDSLRNIIDDPRVGLLFMIPGVNETLRINGRAVLSTNPELIANFVVNDQAPKCVIVIAIDTVYFQCARALARSKLWDVSKHAVPKSVPTAGQMTKSAMGDFDADAYDAALPARQAGTLY
jgi:uncharacterized protein